MGNRPLISVLIPARNCEAYVADAINSILQQTFQDWELLVCDDGSTDGTRFVIDRFNDPRIHRFHNEIHRGVVYTRNKLLAHASGEFITWLDADDISYETRLDRLLEAFDKDSALALCGSNVIRRYRLSGECIVTDYPLTHEEVRASIALRRRFPFTGSSVAFRRQILEDVEGFRPFFDFGGEDEDFILRVSEKYCVGNIPDVLYEYRYTRNSTSRRFSKNVFLKLYHTQILFFLAEQRALTGLDGLMEGGDQEQFLGFIERLRLDFERDISIVYRRACQSKISNHDYAFALLDALHAVKANPTNAQNCLLFPHILGSFLKLVVRVLKRKLLR